MDGGLSSIKVLFLSVFLLQDGGGANAGQHALEMSPGTSHSVCLLPEGSGSLFLSLTPPHLSLTAPFKPFVVCFPNF